MDRAERLLEELAASREYRDAALDHLVRIYEQQGDWANALKVFHELPPAVQQRAPPRRGALPVRAGRAGALQGDTERARTLLRQARTHDAELPRADILTARITELAGDAGGALTAVSEGAGGLPGAGARDHPARAGACQRRWATSDMLERAGASACSATGRVSARQLAWLLATALPPQEVRRCPGVAGDWGRSGVGRGRDFPGRAADAHRRCRRALPVRRLRPAQRRLVLALPEVPLLGQHAAGGIQMGGAHRRVRARHEARHPR